MTVLEQCRELPRSGESWTVDTRTDDGTDPLSLWASLDRDEFRGFTVGAPADEDYAELLSGIFSSPTEGEPGRPSTVVVASEQEKQTLGPLLARLDIAVQVQQPTPDAASFFDDVRPSVVQQLMLGATLPDDVDSERFGNLLDAVHGVQEADPWSVLPAQSALMVGGLGPEPIAVLLGHEEGVKAMGVVALRHNRLPDPDREGLWLQYVPDTILGQRQAWAHVGFADDQPIREVEQVDLLVAAAEVLTKSVTGGAPPPEEQSFVLEDWVFKPTAVDVIWVGDNPSPKPAARRRRRR